MINLSGGGEFKFNNTAARRSAENTILTGRTVDGETRKVLFKGTPISLSDMRGLSDLEVAGISKLVGNSVGSSQGENAKISEAAKDILNSGDIDVSRVLTAAEKLKRALEEVKRDNQATFDISRSNSDASLNTGQNGEEVFPPEEDRARKTILAATKVKPIVTPEAPPPTPLPPVAGGPDHRARLRPKELEKDFIYGRTGPTSGSVNDKNNILSPLFPDSGSDGLIWPYTPNITYAPTIDYQNHALAFANQDYYSYSKTPSAAIQIVGQFTAQSPSEARYSLACIHFLRVVTKMHFGEAEKKKSFDSQFSRDDDFGGTSARNSLSEPPPKLLFSAYGKFGFKDIPVYVQNFSIDFSDQVNHVPVESSVYFGETSGVKRGATRTTWIPANFTMTVSLQPQIHPADWGHPRSSSETQFNWNDFATGKLFEKSSGGWL